MIIAHNNWWQLKKLIQLLDADNHDFYIHVDKKSSLGGRGQVKDELLSVPKKSKIHIFQEFEVFWGGFSLVEAELFLFENAHLQQYDYYHLISGADLPLKSNRQIDSFFERNQGKEFIQYDENTLKNDPRITARAKYYHFLQNYRRRYSQKWKNELFTFMERVSLIFQMLFRINRVRNLDWTIKYGSNWVSITDDLVEKILSHKDKITKVFSCTSCADELYIQTIAFNYGYKDRIYIPEDGMTENVRFIDWARGKNANPYTFRKQDEKLLMENNNLFARKFSETIDPDIITAIYEKIKDENN